MQSIHVQSPLQVCAPSLPQACEELGAHAPSPVHNDHSNQWPLRQLRVRVPQSPQASLAEPSQASTPSGAVGAPSRNGLFCVPRASTGLVADDQLPHGGRLFVLVGQAVLTASVKRSPLRSAHRPAGSWMRVPSTFQPSLPSSSGTQQTPALQIPSLPSGNSMATFNRSGDTWSGSGAEQLPGSIASMM
jgi:hypothetical protein